MRPTNLPRILIVDDEQYVREGLGRDLRGHFECLSAEDFKSAQEILEQTADIEVILVDESLPDSQSGRDLLRICQRDYPLIVRCLISGHMELSEITEALGQSLYHRFFFKPWEPKFLVFQMKECLILAQALRESKLDPLTGLMNRRGFEEQILREIDRSSRHERKLSLALLDVDGFKNINDNRGHAAGDEFLKTFAEFLHKSLRSIDYVARIGGDEFAVLLPDTTCTAANLVMTRLLHEMRTQFVNSVSIGVVEFAKNQDNKAQLLARADKLLYKAKQAGRDRVEVQE